MAEATTAVGTCPLARESEWKCRSHGMALSKDAKLGVAFRAFRFLAGKSENGERGSRRASCCLETCLHPQRSCQHRRDGADPAPPSPSCSEHRGHSGSCMPDTRLCAAQFGKEQEIQQVFSFCCIGLCSVFGSWGLLVPLCSVQWDQGWVKPQHHLPRSRDGSAWLCAAGSIASLPGTSPPNQPQHPPAGVGTISSTRIPSVGYDQPGSMRWLKRLGSGGSRDAGGGRGSLWG